ncbi:MAG: D-glycero-beta-D-manno-heptose 1-phosphate adenylyltransferase [Thermodesulfobacteriota bacterium]
MLNQDKIMDLQGFLQARAQQLEAQSLVFTNGCFDLLHPGHVDLLQRAKSYGDKLMVGLNSDSSVQSLKGWPRPIMPEMDRARVLCGLECVDYIIIFEQDTPLALIQAVRPQVLIKGGDWPKQEIVGREVVEEQNGLVLSLPLLSGYSSSELIQKIRGL